MSQPNRTLTDEEIDLISNECVRFIINKSVTKVPIKRSEILKFLNKIRDGLSRHTNQILQKSNQKLLQIYGFKLIELNKSQYILTLQEEDHLKIEEKFPKSHLLLISSLSHILMNGGSVKEDAMWRFLDKAGLMTDGDTATQKILTHQFTKELYLNFVKIGEPDNPKFIFEWGPRAIHEVPKMYLLKKIGEAFNRPPEYWCEQNKDALEAAEQSSELV